MEDSKANHGYSDRLPLLKKNKTRCLWKIYVGAFSAHLYTLILGMAESYSAPATVDMKKSGSRFMDITENQITWIASLPVLLSGIGCIGSSYTSRWLGRRSTLLLISPLYVLSWLMIAYAPTIYWIYAGRLLCGICFGVCITASPAYGVEIAPVKIRGLLGSGNHLFFGMGTLIMLTLGYVLRWSWLAVAGAIVTTLAACLMYLMPESPEWLYRNSMITDSLESFRYFNGKRASAERDFTENMGHQLSKTNNTWKQLRDPAFYKPFLISVCLIFFQKFSGINTINSYSVEIFQNTGSALDAHASAILIAAVNIFSTIFSSFLMDRTGRRILFIVSGSFMTLALTLMGVYQFMLSQPYDLNKWSWVPLVCLMVYMFFFAWGFGPIPMVMIPELVPISSRSTVLAMSLICGSVFAFTVTKSFSFVVDHIQYYGLFWTHGVFAFIGTLFGVFFLPETKGRTINEISSSFSD